MKIRVSQLGYGEKFKIPEQSESVYMVIGFMPTDWEYDCEQRQVTPCIDLSSGVYRSIANGVLVDRVI